MAPGVDGPGGIAVYSRRGYERERLISGTAPPRAVLPSGLRDFGGVLPLSHLVTAVQDPWFGFGWSGADLAVLAVYAVAAGLPALWLFRWD